ncbi:general secretion pathway protein D [Roseateles depolymerans]|uniref:General secretion pathway protein D n=1 Tax=Roseateles depolymerans TaxID=76731 RepID=A0A0U3L6H3_9BURK|nr:General secretion pathway protein D [Roseateles depolymerans]REG19841.1 general secretion pathway protein D [Roseateles depolymerans]
MSTSSLAVVKFIDADVDAVARAVAAILGRPILVDPRVKGKMTLVSDEGLTRPQVYQYFASTLRGLGYAVVESAGLLKIVPESDAKVQSGTVVAGPDARSQDQIVTRIFPLQYENASNLVSVLRPLIAANNTINVNAGNNSLVITDYADNQARLASIIAALDTPSATDVEVIPLKHMQAATVAQIVSKMVDGVQRAQGASGSGTATVTGGNSPAQGSTAGSSAAQVYADISSNALLVRAPSQARLQAIRALVSRLDKPGTNGIAGSSIHVIYLKHAEATRLASVLRAAFSAQDSNNGLNDSGSGASGGGGSRSSSASSGLASTSGGSASTSDSSTGSGASSKQATAPVSATADPSTGGFIQADPATNALIITASEPRFRELSAVVDLLDANRAQVYVESLIVEVDASKALDVGIQWKQIFNISATTTDITLGTVVNALESMSGTNILSTANLVTLDNEEAKIVVGQNVPFVTGSYTTTSSSSSSPFQTIERKDVGITLRIRPQIGPNGSIRLTIYQESSSVASTTTPGTTNAGPTTNKRSVESTVTVKDGKIIVLGGLIEDSDTADADHLYGLGRLPLVGSLFSSRSHTRKKTNLLVFLRPVIMLDDDAAERLTLDRYDMIRARQQAQPADVRNVLKDEPPPALLPTQDAAKASQP